MESYTCNRIIYNKNFFENLYKNEDLVDEDSKINYLKKLIDWSPSDAKTYERIIKTNDGTEGVGLDYLELLTWMEFERAND